ncbi:hypothetical protein BJX63DRAFT_440654 [Aspergillus granulosus]|uniref:Uncharacterized protein n=1 Tax=Aspergillus granulosus TaxID=176169 RepID=A0ABR4GUH4_9EURO
MAQSDPDESLVYLACQHIFHGPNSMVRQRKNVKSLIQQNQPALTDLLREYNMDRTSEIRFPELFDVSPAQSAEREASEAETAREEANTLKEISEKGLSGDIIPKPQTQLSIEEKEELAASKSTPSLYPVYIHYRSQHIITTSIQRLVEEGCFTYAERHFPQLLVKNGWDCPEAVELTEWIKLFSQHSSELITTKKPLEELFSNLRALRHSAVHRLRKTTIGVERLAKNAQLERVSRLRRELKTAIEELQRNKDLLEGKDLAEIKEIQTQRAALDMRERDATNTMVHGDLQCLNDVDNSFEKFIYYFNLRDPTEKEGKGKREGMERFVESLVNRNSVDCPPYEAIR